jgi:hypothetical protein
MRILVHKKTGTRHIPQDDHRYQSLCGYNGVSPDAREMWDVAESSHLEDFPQDFGNLPSDCDKCAQVME